MDATFLRRIIGLLAAVLSTGAVAQDNGTAEGFARAVVVEPLTITALDELRFGVLVQPLAAGTISVDPDNQITTSGGVTVEATLSTATRSRGAATFILVGEANRRFIIQGKNKITLSNGSATMSVSQVRANTSFGQGRFDSSGQFLLRVGGRLDVAAAQAPGLYTGTFTIRVVYQ